MSSGAELQSFFGVPFGNQAWLPGTSRIKQRHLPMGQASTHGETPKQCAGICGMSTIKSCVFDSMAIIGMPNDGTVWRLIPVSFSNSSGFLWE